MGRNSRGQNSTRVSVSTSDCGHCCTTEADAFARNLLGLAELWINKDDKDYEKQNRII